jgi:hypothetical protein
MSEIAYCLFTKNIQGWSVRIDRPHSGPHAQKHVHVFHRNLKGEYSWNIDGTRHDKHKFPASEQQIGRAKELGSQALNVPVSTLQFLTAVRGGHRITISTNHKGDSQRPRMSTYVRKNEHLVLLESQTGFLVVVIAAE